MRLLQSFPVNKTHYKNYLLLLLICLLAYWPLTFGIFSVKNDAIHYFLPYRYNISEAIRNGEWPFWSPYIYLGYPVYGDMQSGAWNPVVWLFSLFGRYDLTLFHYENLLYIFLAGVGMYKLSGRFVNHSQAALLVGVSYMLSGFMLSGQLINWLASAAFIPFVILYYLRSLESARYANGIKTAIALYFLFTAGYPSFFILTCYLVFMLFMIRLFDNYRTGSSNKKWKALFGQHVIILLIFAGLSMPAIVSYIDLLPYYQRGTGAGYSDVVRNSFEWQHLLSFLFPSAISTNDIISTTDVTCRNLYVGLFVFPVLAAIPPKKGRTTSLLILMSVFAFLFSLGDSTPVRKICYRFFPLMDTFRHPSQMRLFVILPLLLLLAPGLKKVLNNELSLPELKKLRALTWLITAALLLVTVMAFTQSSIMEQFTSFRSTGIRVALKKVMESLSLHDVVTLNGLIQLFFLSLFLLWLKKTYRPPQLISLLWVTNMFVMAQLLFPVTFVSKTSPGVINGLIHQYPEGFPVAGLQYPVAENSLDAYDNFDKLALSYFYNKKIGISKTTNSPSFLEQQEHFLSNNFLYNYVGGLPVAYTAGRVVNIKDTARADLNNCNYAFADTLFTSPGDCDTNNRAVIKKLSANHFEIETHTNPGTFIVLTQNFHHHWQASVDGIRQKIYKTNTSFMGIPLTPGKHRVIFRFIPSNTLNVIWLPGATIVLLILFTAISLTRKPNVNR